MSRTIVVALEAGFARGAGFSVGIAAVWLALCYVAVNLGWRHILSRLLLAFAITVVFALLPYLGPILALANLTNPNCHPNEGGVGPCVIFGGNVGDAAHMAVTEGWLTLIGGPIAFGTFVIYLIVMTIIRTVSAYRKTASAR